MILNALLALYGVIISTVLSLVTHKDGNEKDFTLKAWWKVSWDNMLFSALVAPPVVLFPEDFREMLNLVFSETITNGPLLYIMSGFLVSDIFKKIKKNAGSKSK